MSDQLAIPEEPKTDITLTDGKGLQFSDFDQLERFAAKFVVSCICPKRFAGDAGSAAMCIQMGAELGLSPISSLRSIAVINGIPGIYGDAALALVRASGQLEAYSEDYGDGDSTKPEDTDKMGCVVTVKRKGYDVASYSFTIADAKRAGLWKKAGPWTQYPKRMLMFRARGFLLRDQFSDVLMGYKIVEEVADYDTGRGFGNAKQAQPANVAGTTGFLSEAKEQAPESEAAQESQEVEAGS